MTDALFDPTRRHSLAALLGLAVAGCGGGGGGGGDGSSTSADGTVLTKSFNARSNATTYPLTIYIPPNSEGILGTLPVIYLLDGEYRFNALYTDVVVGKVRAMIVAIGNDALRNRDYVSMNSCTPTGGGQVAYFDFIRAELAPWIEATIGGDPKKRILLGHSHGGSFVLYALFARPTEPRHFAAYLASDSSIDCMSGTVYGWEAEYAAVNTALPIKLHIAYAANVGNAAFAAQVETRRYTGLKIASQFYNGGHINMIPAAFADAAAFALA